MTDREIIAEGLVKRYAGNVLAVDDVSFQVQSGEIFGFLGPNGAGKSTIIGMLTTLLRPTSGSARVGGYDVARQAKEVRRVAGVALQEIGLDPLMKSIEPLTIQAQLFGANRKQARTRAHELLDLVKLSDVTNRRVGTYSGGMRRRLDLALALVHEPAILFLDEPTTGPDPASRRDIWSEVRRLNADRGMTIFLTTQYLEEADQLADRIMIIDGGKIAAAGTPAELKAGVGSEWISISLPDTDTVDRARQVLAAMATSANADRTTLRLYLNNAAAAVPGVVTELQQAGIVPAALTLRQPTLDDVFLAVTGQRFDLAPAAGASE